MFWCDVVESDGSDGQDVQNGRSFSDGDVTEGSDGLTFRLVQISDWNIQGKLYTYLYVEIIIL